MKPSGRVNRTYGLLVGLWLISQLGGCSTATSVGPSSVVVAQKEESLEDLSYTFELLQHPTRVRINLGFLGSPTGTTVLLLTENFGGVERIGEEVRNFSVRDSRGNTLTWTHPLGHRWEVEHPPGERLSVDYELVSLAEPQGLDSGVPDYQRPIVSDELFHLIGKLGLLYPEHLWTAQPRSIRVTWRGFKEAGWTVASSHSDNQSGFVIPITIEEFRHALFVAGKLRISRRAVKGGELVVSIAGNEWDFRDDEFVDLAVRLVTAGRDFFWDHNYPYFLISLIPIGKKEKGLRAASGTGLVNSFALFMAPGMPLRGQDEEVMVKQIIAHELFHNWLGWKIVVDQPAELHVWFSEGFTHHYTRRLLYRAGLLSLDEIVNDINETISDYMLSPVRNTPNQRILEDRWKDPDINRLPYLRGDLTAMLLDHEIRLRSKSRQSLDDLMRDLFKRSILDRSMFDNEKLLEIIGEYTSPAFTERLRKIIFHGETVLLPEQTYTPCLRLKKDRLGPYEIGFDVENSMKQKLVCGVVKNSAAYRAGLRDGQKLLGWKIVPNKIRRKVELMVADKEKDPPRNIAYLPQGKPILVPQFVPGPNPKSCPGLL